MLHIKNDGQRIVATNYWDLPLAARGEVLVSVNAGAFRVLLPRRFEPIVQADLVPAVGCAVTRGPWPGMRLDDAIEVLFDDASSNPFALHLSVRSLDVLPAPEDVGRRLVLSVWTAPRRGVPHQALERPCLYRLAPRIPWLRPWREAT